MFFPPPLIPLPVAQLTFPLVVLVPVKRYVPFFLVKAPGSLDCRNQIHVCASSPTTKHHPTYPSSPGTGPRHIPPPFCRFRNSFASSGHSPFPVPLPFALLFFPPVRDPKKRCHPPPPPFFSLSLPRRPIFSPKLRRIPPSFPFAFVLTPFLTLFHNIYP